MTRIVCLILLVFAVPLSPGFAEDTPCPPSVTAPTRSWSASADFSPQQGKEQWAYESLTKSQYLPMQWSAERARWEGPEPYPFIAGDEMHPGRDADAVRTWTAPASGQVRVEGYIDGLSLTYPNCSDGVRASITRDGLVVWSTTLDVRTTSARFSLALNVEVATRLSFVLNKGGANNWCDATAFDPDILYVTAPVAPPGSQLQFFGYYAVRYPALSVVHETFSWANVAFSPPWSYPDAALWQALRNHGMKMIFFASNLFTLDPSGKDGTVGTPSGVDYDLAPDYQSLWQAFVEQSGIQQHLDQILAIYLPDEPFHNGIQCEELTAVANLIKATFPTIPLMFVEASGDGIARMCAPPAIDWVGFDRYGTTAPFSNAAYQRNLKQMKRKLLPHQRVVYVMDGYYGQGHQRAGLVPADLGPIAQSYYAMASADPTSIGILTFTWNDDAGDSIPFVAPLGSKSLPASVLTIHREIGRKIKR